MSTHPTDEQLSAFNDAHLDGAQMRSVARHLAGCASCRQSAQALQQMRDTLRSLPPPAAPAPAFWDDTVRRMRVHQHERFQHEPSRPAFFVSARRRWAAGVALAAMFCAIGVGPLVQSSLRPVNETAPAAELADTVDVSSLMVAHTQSAARQPLADADRQTLLAADGDPVLAFDPSNSDAPR